MWHAHLAGDSRAGRPCYIAPGSGDKLSSGIVACDTFAGEIEKTAGKEFG